MAAFLTSKELAARWGMNEGSLRIMRSEKRGPRWVTLGKGGKGKRPRVRYLVADIEHYERKQGGG